MVRDPRCDIEYFKKSITRYEEENAYYEKSLASGKNRQSDTLKGWIYSGRLRLAISFYSAGNSIKEIVTKFRETLECLDYFSDSVREIEGNKLPLDDYNLMLWTVSLAVLLDRPDNEFEAIGDTLDRTNKPDRLIDMILRHKLKDRALAQDSYYAVVRGGMADRYRPLFALSADLDEQSKVKIISDHLKLWYRRQQLCAWYGSHKKHNYFGYWSFESAALAKIYGISGEAFTKNKYFPGAFTIA